MADYFVVEQGVWSERDKAYGWRHWDSFDNITDARRCARNLVKHPDPRASKLAARVLAVTVKVMLESEDSPAKETA